MVTTTCFTQWAHLGNEKWRIILVSYFFDTIVRYVVLLSLLCVWYLLFKLSCLNKFIFAQRHLIFFYKNVSHCILNEFKCPPSCQNFALKHNGNKFCESAKSYIVKWFNLYCSETEWSKRRNKKREVNLSDIISLL